MSNRRSRRFSFFKDIAVNTTFQWFVGLTVAVLTLIATVAPDKIKNYIGWEDTQKEQPVDPPKASYVPFESSYTITGHQPLFIWEARTNLTVIFQNIEGQEFVSLNIAPEGEKSSVRAALRGYTEKFTSSAGVFHVQILDIDYKKRKVVVQVSRKK
ncbi:MAG: hypothetical protein D3907_11900 [Candidatus Electrothrix sp. AUS3]|nr:hypothetical protein [Candidatus Electrothrix gigas]